MLTLFRTWPKKAQTYIGRTLSSLLMLSLVFSTLFGFSSKTEATGFQTQNGYYVGNGTASHQITGLGFQPEALLIKSTTSAGSIVLKTKDMPANYVSLLSATVADTSTAVTLDSDGFTLGSLAAVNTSNVVYNWTALTGSDCSASGDICISSYAGDGASSRTITTGLQPGLVITKQNAGTPAFFRTASMPTDRTEFFNTTASNTAGAYIKSMAATSFDIGSTANSNGVDHYFIAIKTGTTHAAEGTYTGDGTDNRDIGGLSVAPSFVLTRNSTTATAGSRRAVFNTSTHNGDQSSYTGDFIASAVNFIQELQPTGFQVGSGAQANESGMTFYWFALSGASDPAGSGTFDMAVGTYVGNGTSQSVTGLGFEPDLIIVKDEGATGGTVFRTRLMPGDTTGYLAPATADFAGGITSLDADGFTLGSSTVTNTNSSTYHWQAFGNAYDPHDGTGSADFAIGSHYGSSGDDRNISQVPFQPDLVAVKRSGGTAGVFTTSSIGGGLATYFGATAEDVNIIQSLNADGFQVGTSSTANVNGSLYNWFAFKQGTNFSVGTYAGDAVNDRDITSPGFSPDLVWVKRSTAVGAVSRPSSVLGDSSQTFVASANISGRIKSLSADGFTVGTVAEVNASGGTYRHTAWRVPSAGSLSVDVVDNSDVSVPSPSFLLSTSSFDFSCSPTNGQIGNSLQKIRMSNYTSNPSWTTSIAATDGSTGLWRNSGNTSQFDYNDSGGSPPGCEDDVDSDSQGGVLSIDPSVASITPQVGCTSTGLSLGLAGTFQEGSTDAITLLSASAGSDLECTWDILDIDMDQLIPPSQQPDTYNLNLTITTVSS